MEKELIILTKSDKNNHYCVAGVNREDNGRWVRLENDALRGGAISEEDMTYEDGSVCKELDIVRVECLDTDATEPHQPENVHIDTTQRFRKIGTATWEEVLNLHPMEQYHTVLGRISDRMTPEEAANRRENRSLQLIYVTDLVIEESQREGDRLKHPKGSFSYTGSNGTTSTYRLTVTDPDYSPCEARREIGNAYLIASLGTEFNGDVYLLIAKIIEDANDLVWVTTATNGRRFCHNNPNCRLLQTSRSKSIHPRAWVEQRRIPAHRCDADSGKDGDEN